MANNTVKLADGYNGHTALFYTTILEANGDLVKLQCAEPGLEYCIAWKHVDDVLAAQQ